MHSRPRKGTDLGGMNTVLSAMALDFPAEKLHVYLSDDGGADITLFGMGEAWRFARFWLPFCKRYEIISRSPQAYFCGSPSDERTNLDPKFAADRDNVKEQYDNFKASIKRAREDCQFLRGSSITSKNHPSVIELRVSAVISNSPYILVLDCDMYSNDPSSARQAASTLIQRSLLHWRSCSSHKNILTSAKATYMTARSDAASGYAFNKLQSAVIEL